MYEFAVTPAVTQIRRPGVTIDSIIRESIADEVNLESGDRIVKVNGRSVRDYLDFRFQTAGETILTFLVRKKSGETWEIDLERDEGEDFGIEFEQIVPRQCANECLFCFCKGNPEDARPSLFVRDEDIRLSFLYGNYTTLTSITEDEMDRIIEQRLSPQYVSIHATDLKTRAYLLGVEEKRADISEKLERLLKSNIEIHAQVVLCPEINDGKQLEKTLRDLASHYPTVVSTAIVPVALTRYNKDERLKRVTPEFCRQTIQDVEKLQQEFRDTLGTTFAFLGDEIYLKAGEQIPAKEHYGSYPQIEDGVGMIRSFVNDFEDFLVNLRGTGQDIDRLEKKLNVRTKDAAKVPRGKMESRISAFSSLTGTILTGEMFAPILQGLIEQLNNLIGSRFVVAAVPNTYFGGDVSVAGLISGQDIAAVRDQISGDFIIVPDNLIKSDEPIFIDGMRFDDLKKKFDIPIHNLSLDQLLNAIANTISNDG